MTGSPVELLLVMFIAVAVIHALVTPPVDTRWRDEIVRAMLELDARQRLAHPELAIEPASEPVPEPPRFIEVSVVEPAEARPRGRDAREPIDREEVRDWSDDSAAPPWSSVRDPRVSADGTEDQRAG